MVLLIISAFLLACSSYFTCLRFACPLSSPSLSWFCFSLKFGEYPASRQNIINSQWNISRIMCFSCFPRMVTSFQAFTRSMKLKLSSFYLFAKLRTLSIDILASLTFRSHLIWICRTLLNTCQLVFIGNKVQKSFTQSLNTKKRELANLLISPQW